MLPLIGLVAIGAAIWKGTSSSGSSGGSSSNRGDVERDYKREKRTEIHSDIDGYKATQVEYIERKYGVKISIDSETSKVSIVTKDTALKKIMKELHTNTSELKAVISLLKGEKIAELMAIISLHKGEKVAKIKQV